MNEFQRRIIITICNTSKDSVCLISKDPMEENCITLSCGHSFNYVPLYNASYFKKELLNNFEPNKINNQIKCPYCEKL